MDRAEIDNFLENMYASGLAAQQTVVNQDTLALSQSDVPVVLPMPHHSHLGSDGSPVVQAGTGMASGAAGGSKGPAAVPLKERVPANQRGPHKEKTVPPAETVTVAGLEPPLRGSRPGPAGSTRGLQRRRRQNDSGGEEEGDVETIGARQQKRARQAPLKAPRELREEVKGLQRELGEAKDRLADVERRLSKADCDAADARGKLAVAVERDLERNNHVSKLEQDMSLLRDRVAAKDKKVEILQRESAARLTEVKRLEGEVARLGAEGSRAAAAA
ncbi:hypothetical protein ABKV19_005303, partial [Rosa sericea]